MRKHGVFSQPGTGKSHFIEALGQVDIAEPALGRTREGTSDRIEAEFRVGAFEDTGLEDQAADAVMRVDALLFRPKKAAALRELRRILRPGGRLVMTSWDYHRQPVARPPQVGDGRTLLSGPASRWSRTRRRKALERQRENRRRTAGR